MPVLTIDGRQIEVPEGTSVLEACRQAGAHIPTLCYLEGFSATGACRLCLVEIEGARTLVASCAQPATEGMVVKTNSPRVRRARRAVLELLLSEHDGDCYACLRSGDCELRQLAATMGVDEITYPGERTKKLVDESTPALVRDTGKCVSCRRCVTVCSQVQGVTAIFPQYRGFETVIGPAFASDLSDVVCVQCGQCAAVCPVGAILENTAIDQVWEALEDPTKHVIVQTAPAIRAALGEEFGYPPGTRVTGKMVSALRRLGFDAVFDTNFAADLTIIEEGNELLSRLKKALVEGKPVALPMFTSCSPGWIKYMEHFNPDMLSNLSTCKSPQQMFGALAKTYYADKLGKRPEDIVVVSVMPCTAKKFEAQRPEMGRGGVPDVDYVLTTRELARMIKMAGIDFRSLPDDKMDRPLGISTGAADIFAVTGGVMEAALRTAYEIVTGKPFPFPNLHVTPIVGLEGVKEASITIEGALPEWSFLEGVTVNVAVAHGLANAQKVIDRIRSGEATYHFVEVMTCPGGCIGGAGQPRFTDNVVRAARIRAIYEEDESKELRKSHENPDIKALYEEFLGEPLGHKSHELLHTSYTPRERV
ncbi:MAG: NADH-dependent [FeFe] hydrogenase, group A6 [Thermoleophilia bacterium]|nr:NADH-dependent [FeFe] hydrogenase, group A6 [Thermoleophilia bacterium]